ncbi:MAG: hypothetical protein ACR2OA_11500 [Rubripirellula sp.]
MATTVPPTGRIELARLPHHAVPDFELKHWQELIGIDTPEHED